MKNIKVRLTFTEGILGTSPANEDIYRDFIGSKAPDAASIEDEVEALGVDAVVEKGMTVFPKLPDGTPILYDYQIKGFFKDACGMLACVKTTKSKEACNAQFAEILAEQTALKKQKEEVLQSSTDADRVCTRMKQAEEAIENTASTITEWKENAVRQIVERVTVLSADEILVQIKGGAEIKQRLERT